MVSRRIHSSLNSSGSNRMEPINIVASIESARALFNIGEIAGWQSEFGALLGGRLTALLVRMSYLLIDACHLSCISSSPRRTVRDYLLTFGLF